MLNQSYPNSISELIEQIYEVEKAKKIQKKYAELLNTINTDISMIKSTDCIEFIAGIDISYFRIGHLEYGTACVVLWDFDSHNMIESQLLTDEIKFPYIPGYLGFREVPLMVKTLKKLENKPDVIICDGHGVIHPRKFGEATHLGYALNLPSIGIAKNPFIGESSWKSMKRIKSVKTPVEQNNQTIGYAVCLSDQKKPVFISVGYKIDLNLAIKIALELTGSHRLPEPLFLADKISRNEVSKIQEK